MRILALIPGRSRLPDAPDRTQAGYARSLLLLIIILLLVSLAVWAANTELDEVKRGTGKVVPSRQIQVIQCFESGVVKQVHAREGKIVETGELLMELDPVILQSQVNQARQQTNTFKARIIRLGAEAKGQEPVFPDEILTGAPAVVASERALYQGRKAELAATVQILQGQSYQRQQELNEAKVAVATATKGIELAQKELNIIKPLVDKGIEPEISALQLQRTLNEMKGRKEAAELAITRLTAAIRETDDKIKAEQERFRSETLKELSAVTAQLSEIEQAMPALGARLQRTEIRSPVKGVVNRVLATTIGAVTQAGAPLIEVVPLDDALLVEASIKPADIAFLRPGQDVTVKITAYDYSRYGSLHGKLTNISADAVKQPSGESVYQVQVRTESNALASGSERLEIIPGMVAEVDIATDKKSILDYLIRPVLKVKNNAFRE